MSEIFKTPDQTVDIRILYLNPTTTLGKVYIPSNFLSYRIVNAHLTLECPSRVNDQNENEQVPIIIHPNAFHSSSNFLLELNIRNCDLGRLDLSFLFGFENLVTMNFTYPSSIEKANWNFLPSLPVLTNFEIEIHRELQNDWNEWVQKLQPLTNGLEKFICNCGVDDKTADRLVQWLVNSSAATLNNLELRETKLTRVPQGISNFQNLMILKITCNDSEIKVLKENSIKLNVLPSEIEISNCGIGELHPGAIQGKNTQIIYSIVSFIILKEKKLMFLNRQFTQLLFAVEFK